jgi:hypothetical protein
MPGAVGDDEITRRAWRAEAVLTVEQVAGDLAGVDSSAPVVCPFPDHADSAPSFQVYPGDRGFHCFGCGRSGGVVQFVRLLRGCGFEEAVAELEERYGLEGDGTAGWVSALVERDRNRTNETLPDRPLEKLAGRAIEHHAALMNSGGHHKWIRAWKLTWQVCNIYMLGWDADERRLTFPVRDAGGRVLDIRMRREGAKQHKVISVPGCGRGGHLYGLCEAQDKMAEGATVVVVGGEKDVVIASANIPEYAFVSSTLGEGGWNERMSRPLAGRRVVVFLDADRAGREGSLKVARALRGYADGCSVVRWRSPDVKHLPESERAKADVSDLVLAGHVAVARQMLASAGVLWPSTAERVGGLLEAERGR